MANPSGCETGLASSTRRSPTRAPAGQRSRPGTARRALRRGARVAARARPPDRSAAARDARRDEVIDPWLEEIRDPMWHGTPAEKAAEAYANCARGAGRGTLARAGRRRVDARLRHPIRAGASSSSPSTWCRPVRSRPAGLADRRTGRPRSPRRARRHELGHDRAPARARPRHRGSGTGSCSDTPRSAGSRRWSWPTGTRSRSQAQRRSSTSVPTSTRTRADRARVRSPGRSTVLAWPTAPRPRSTEVLLVQRLHPAQRGRDRRHDPPR
jgi:hypothetical protein